jgi:3D (Asp-Asp-Asp) domain-containing protein
MRLSNIFNLRHIVFAAIVLFAAIAAWETLIYWRHQHMVFVDGKQLFAQSNATTVSDFLKELKITLDDDDIVEPDLMGPLPRRGMVRIIRVAGKKERTEEELPPELIWRKQYTSNLRPIELQKEIRKKRISDSFTIYYDSAVHNQKIISTRTIKKTVFQLALIGAGGKIEKTYDLNSCKKMRMVATAYYPGDPLAWGDGTVTFLGQKMRRGIIAVDPNVIPLHTRLYVPGYGYGFAGDTGNKIKGKRVDLGVNNKAEEKPFMHKRVTVYILEKADSW